MGNWENNEYIPAEYDYFERAYNDMIDIKKEELNLKVSVKYSGLLI